MRSHIVQDVTRARKLLAAPGLARPTVARRWEARDRATAARVVEAAVDRSGPCSAVGGCTLLRMLG